VRDDTVFRTTVRWRTKYIERTSHDTVYQASHDTIPAPFPVTEYVERPVSVFEWVLRIAGGWALLAVVAVALLVLGKMLKQEEINLPLACPDAMYMCMMAAGAFAFMGAGVFGLMEGMELMEQYKAGVAMMASYPAALLLCGGLSVVSGVCTLVVGKAAYRPGTTPGAGLFAVIPPFAMLVWLFATHQEHATDPVLMRYGIYLAAAALLLMAHYDVAAFYQNHRHPRRFLFCALMGTALAITAMADGLTVFQMAMAAACALSGLGQCVALLSTAADSEY
jgi:hypothetical protein